jgi:hypothetical protein
LREVKNLVFVNNISYHDRDMGFALRVHQGTFLHNVALENLDNGGFWLKFPMDTLSFKNNLSAYNAKGDMASIATCPAPQCSNNWTKDETGGKTLSGDPDLINRSLFKDASGNISIQFPTGLSIAEKVAFLQKTVRGAFALAPTSPAIAAGTPVSYIDPRTQQQVDIPFSGSAPNIGIVDVVVPVLTASPSLQTQR